MEPLTSVSATDGHHGRLVYAAAAITSARVRTAIVLTRRVPSSGSGVGFFLLAASAALVIAALVGDRLGRRIAKPLVDAEATTRRIAAGDLAARVPQPAGADKELASLAASINTMAENLGRLRDVERDFLLSVSHDLRTPLTSIRGFAEAISDGATDDSVRAAGVIAAEARRLERLVGDLLDLARLGAREFKLDLQPVDVASIVTDTADGFRPEAKDAGVGLTVHIDDPRRSATAVADGERLAQVVANLVENALKFAASRIDVDVEAGTNAVIIAVSDDGPGIPPGEENRVFQRLYQPERSAAAPRRVGSGLGLAIVAELVHAMGGSVRAAAAPGGGTRVSVSLPATASSASSA
jgi:two-component system sensor histidine kinase BaeS